MRSDESIEEKRQFSFEIGLRLWALRNFYDLSQGKFATKLGVNQSAYNKWEAGNAFPSEVKVRAICKLCRVDFNYIYEGNSLGLSEPFARKLNELVSYRYGQLAAMHSLEVARHDLAAE